MRPPRATPDEHFQGHNALEAPGNLHRLGVNAHLAKTAAVSTEIGAGCVAEACQARTQLLHIHSTQRSVNVVLLMFAASILPTCLTAAPVSPEPPDRGAWIENVVPNFPAAVAGLEPGDRLVSWQPQGALDAAVSPGIRSIDDAWDVLAIEYGDAQVTRGMLTIERRGHRKSLELPSAVWGWVISPSRIPTERANLNAPDRTRRVNGDPPPCHASDIKPTEYADSAAGTRARAWQAFACARALSKLTGMVSGKPQFDKSLQLLSTNGNENAAIAARLAWADDALPARQWVLADTALEGMAGPIGADTEPAWRLLARLQFARAELGRGAIREALANLSDLAAVVAKRFPISTLHAMTLASLARAQCFAGDCALAVSTSRAATALILKGAAGFSEEADVRIVGGVVLRAAGNLDAADVEYKYALTILKRTNSEGAAMAAVLHNLAIVQWDRGNLSQADDLLRQSLAIRQLFPWDHESLAVNYNRLANLTFDRGDPVEANDFLVQGRRELKRAGVKGPQAAANFNQSGLVAMELGDLGAAEIWLHKAADLFRSLQPESGNESAPLHHLGTVSFRRGRMDEAKERYLAALAIRMEKTPGSQYVALIYEDLAEVELALSNVSEARTYALLANRILSQLAPTTDNYARALSTLGKIAALSGDPDKARTSFCDATEVLDGQRTRISADPGRRSEFLALFRETYRSCIEAEAHHNTERSFLVAERFRARSLVEMLAGQPDLLEEGLSPGLRSEQDALRLELDGATVQLAATRDENPAERRKLSSRINSLRSRRTELETRIRVASPRYAAIRLPEPIDAKTAAGLLPADAASVTYVLGESKSLALVLRPGDSKPVPISLSISARELKMDVGKLRAIIGSGTAQAETTVLLGDLYRRLILPLQDSIGDAARLVIIPDGELSLIPFAALRDQNGKYLVESLAVSMVSSFTVLAELSARPQSRSKLSILAVGDPVLNDGAPASIGGRDIRTLPSLPNSRREALAVSKAYSGPGIVMLGSQASEDAIRVSSAATQVIHFAVHGVFDSGAPLNSALVLGAAHGTSALPGDDGIAHVWEIFDNWKLDANLVVLSACETAQGEASASEGLLGFTRAFQSAGARAVVSTLWSVPDRITADLMIRFHERRAQGVSTDIALREAQLSILHGGDDGTQAGASRGVGGLVFAQRGTNHQLPPYVWAGIAVWGDGLR